MNSAAEIWKTILTLLENEMTPTAVSTWFSEIEPVSLDENRFVLCCPTEFKRSIVSTRYLPTLERAFYELFAEQITVEVISPEERDQLAAAPAAKPAAAAKPAVETDDAFLRKLRTGQRVIAVELDSPKDADLTAYLEGARRLQAAGADGSCRRRAQTC